MRDTVSFIETEPTFGCLHIHDNAFSYEPRRGWAWLQRLCFQFLAWRRCHHASEFVTYRRIDVQPRDFMTELFRQQANLTNVLGRGGELLLIGSDDWMEVLRQSNAPLYAPIAFDGEYYVPRFRDIDSASRLSADRERRQMRVCVVPWMRGMVIVPREAFQRTA